MNKYLQLVEEFHKTFNQPILEKPTIIDQERFNFRLSLIAEEESELIEAYNNKDKVEVLDALADLQFVLSGAILELGYKDVFDEAFQRVFDSNMSKVCSSKEEADNTVEHYFRKGILTHYEQSNGKWLIYRSADNKVLKNVNYSPVQLQDLAQ